MSTADEFPLGLSLALTGDELLRTCSFQQIGQCLCSLSRLRAKMSGRDKEAKTSSRVCNGRFGAKKFG